MRDEVYNLKILDSHWYYWPNCAVLFETSEEASKPALIGIIKAQNIQTKEIKQYIGIGKGDNQRNDELSILNYRIPFFGNI